MPSIELTKDNFDDTVTGSGIVLVNFHASWSPPSLTFTPIFEAAAGRHLDIVFGKVDTDAQQKLVETFRITRVPTLKVFRDQVVIHSRSGEMSAQALEDLIAKIHAVDMDDVRRQLTDRAHQH